MNLNLKELSSFNISQIEDELKKEMARRKLSEYSKQAWHVVEPATKYIDNWHIDAIAEHLEAVTDGQIKRLLVNIPPRCEKSLNGSVFWPTWVWGPKGMPHIRWLFISYAESLSIRDSIKCRNVIQSSWYQKNWGNVYKLAGDQNEKRKFKNDKTGERIASSIDGTNTGEGGDIVVIDDPHNVRDGESEAIRESTVLTFREVIPSRLNDPKTGAIVVFMQRVHDGDVSGQILKEGGYVHLCLPMEYEPKRMITTPIGFNDPRTIDGELLWPERIGKEEVEAYKKSLGSYAYAGQYQQRPTPRGGGMIKKHWLRYWKPKGRELPPVTVRLEDGSFFNCPIIDLPDEFDIKIQSWDMNFKETKDSAFVCGQVLAQKVANRFLLDQIRENIDFIKTLSAFAELTNKHTDVSAKYIEDKANGPAVISALHEKISGIVPIQPEGDKVARMASITYLIEAGNYYIPHPALFPWVEEYIAELTAFPKSAYKDQCDTTSQGLNKLRYDYPAPVENPLDKVEQQFGKGSPEYAIWSRMNESGKKVGMDDLY
jgi:predicted phage terminase large subunit-like protein